MTEVLTLPTRKISTCLPALISIASACWIGSDCRRPASTSVTTMRYWSFVSWSRMAGATSAAARACCAHRRAPTRSRSVGWRPTMLEVRVRRYRCTGCGHVWRQDTSSAAAPRAKLSRHAVLWALKSVMVDRLLIASVAAGLGTSWHTANDAVLAAGRQLLINDLSRFDGVRVIGG